MKSLRLFAFLMTLLGTGAALAGYNLTLTVSGTYNATATAVTVTAASALPNPISVGPYLLEWWNNTNFTYANRSLDPNYEQVVVTAVNYSTKVLTITRGAGYTSGSTKNGAGTYSLFLANFTPHPPSTGNVNGPGSTVTNTLPLWANSTGSSIVGSPLGYLHAGFASTQDGLNDTVGIGLTDDGAVSDFVGVDGSGNILGQFHTGGGVFFQDPTGSATRMTMDDGELFWENSNSVEFLAEPGELYFHDPHSTPTETFEATTTELFWESASSTQFEASPTELFWEDPASSFQMTDTSVAAAGASFSLTGSTSKFEYDGATTAQVQFEDSGTSKIVVGGSLSIPETVTGVKQVQSTTYSVGSVPTPGFSGNVTAGIGVTIHYNSGLCTGVN